MATQAEPWLDDLAEGVVLIDGIAVRRVNAAAAAMLGVDPGHASGRPLIAVVRDHRLEKVWLDGVPAELVVRGRRIAAARIAGGLALRDVSEARLAQENARELLAVLSHELRTPATTIRSTLEALAYDDLPSEVRARLLERASNEADRLVRLLSDLTVDVAPPRERSVPLAPLIDRALAILDGPLSEHGVRVACHVPDVEVYADPDKVLQVLLNLIENAAAHGPDDAVVEVMVDVVAEASGATVAVRVRDRGEPLPPARIEGLFALHARGPSPKARGTGLGLYVVRTIAERWGGRAWGRAWSADGPPGPEDGNEFGVLVPAGRRTAEPVRSDVADGGPSDAPGEAPGSEEGRG